MISGIKRYNPNFTANYDLVDADTYRVFIKNNINDNFGRKETESIQSEGIYAGYKTLLNKSSHSDGFIMCNGICFSNVGIGTTNHIFPNVKTKKFLNDINNFITKDYKNIAKFNKPIDILLTGGNSRYENSVALEKSLSSKLSTFKGDITVLWGLKNKNTMSLGYHGEKDTYLIHIPDFDLSKIKTIKDVSEFCFEKIIQGKRAKFFVMGKRIF